MTSNIIEVTKNAKEIVKFDHKVTCPECSERYFASFDKLYIEAYGVCFECDTNEDTTRSDNIFAIVESEL